MRVLVCGGRNYDDYVRVAEVLTEIGPTFIMQGGAGGADALAFRYALSHGVDYATYPARWRDYGKGAGPRRNQFMLDDGKPDLVVAFPGGKGTRDMVSRAVAAGVPIRVVV